LYLPPHHKLRQSESICPADSLASSAPSSVLLDFPHIL
jgi:hypothetical protein